MARDLPLTAAIAEFKFIELSTTNGTAATTETETKIDLMFVETKSLNLNAKVTEVIRE